LAADGDGEVGAVAGRVPLEVARQPDRSAVGGDPDQSWPGRAVEQGDSRVVGTVDRVDIPFGELAQRDVLGRRSGRGDRVKRFTTWLLLWVERWYLHAHGWDRFDGMSYRLPDNYPFRRKYKTYTHGHAVNAQKQVSRS